MSHKKVLVVWRRPCLNLVSQNLTSKSGDFEKPGWGDMAFLKTTEHSDRDSFGTPVDYSNFIQPGSKGRRGIKKGRNILWTNFYKIYILPNKKPLNREWERKGCRLIEAEVGDCLKEVCAENSELAPYHNNYSSTMSQLFVCFVSATLSPLSNTFWQNIKILTDQMLLADQISRQ